MKANGVWLTSTYLESERLVFKFRAAKSVTVLQTACKKFQFSPIFLIFLQAIL